MKKLITLIIALHLALFSYSQSITDFFVIGDHSIAIDISKESNQYILTLRTGDKTKTFNYGGGNLDVIDFRQAFRLTVKNLLDDANLSSIYADNISIIDDQANETFFNLMANLRTLDALGYKPKSGKLLVASKIPVYINPDSPEPIAYLEVNNVQMEFYKGFLELIKIVGQFKPSGNDNFTKIPELMKETDIIFENKFGIGFTSKNNYKKLANQRLFLNQVQKNFEGIRFGDLPTELDDYKKEDLKNKAYIKLDDLITYDYEVNPLTRDFSPSDQKVEVSFDQEGKLFEEVTLFKEESYQILEAEVFSDFQGFDSDSPNGLIQLVIKKQFNIRTARQDFFRGGFGFLEYIEFGGNLSKIEEKERRLNPERIDNEIMLNGEPVIDAKRYTDPVELFNYRTWNVGADINVFMFDIPNWKNQIHINGGARFNRTAIQDSIKTVGSDFLVPEEYSASYWTFYPEVKLHILPEERYGIFFMYRPTFVHLISVRIEFKDDLNPANGERRNLSNWVSDFEFKGYVDVGETGKLFLRWRLNSEFGYSKNNFTQIQLGYSFYVLGKKPENNSE